MSKISHVKEWRWHRWQIWQTERDEFVARNVMRQVAQLYAASRGWRVALTPPQRRTPAPSTGAGEVTP